MPKNIFSLLDTPAYGGAEEYLLAVLFHLSTRGYTVVLATNNSAVKQKARNHIRVIDLPYRLDAIGNWKGLVKYFLALPSSLFWVFQTIRSFPSLPICIFPGFSDRLSFSPLVKWMGCRLMWLEYGPLEPTFQRNFGFPKLLYAITRSYPDKIITISDWTKKSLLSVGRIPLHKISIIYPGVDTRQQNMKQETSGKRMFTVIAIARMATEKEIDVLLQAWRIAEMKDCKLILIGDGPERKSLEQLAKDLEISHSVHFMGFIPEEEKRMLLKKADLFVFPSAWSLEGFGMTTIEAMVAGLPILTTGYGPQAEIVQNEKNGWYFHPHDSGDLAKKLQIALESNRRKTFAKESVMIVKRKFSLDKMLISWEKELSFSSK